MHLNMTAKLCTLHSDLKTWAPRSENLVIINKIGGRLGRKGEKAGVISSASGGYEHLFDARNTMVSARALETLFLHQFWTFLFLGVCGQFLGCSLDPKSSPLDVVVLGGLASESAEMPERNQRNWIWEPNRSRTSLAEKRTEPNWW